MAKGYVHKRGKNSWEISVYVGKDPVTGRDRYIRKTVHCETKTEAKRMALDLANAVAQGRYVEPAKLTVAEFLHQWLENYAKPNVRPTTYAMYEMLIRVHVIPALGSIPMAKLRPLDVQKFYAEKLNSPRADGQPGTLSPKTVKHIHEVLRVAFHSAVQWQLIEKSPIDAVEAPRVPDRPPLVWTQEQCMEFLNVASEHRLFAAFFLLLTTGMRRGEVLGLMWQDVNFDHQYISVQRALVPTPDGLRLQELKTKSSRRLVSLPDITVRVLQQHWQNQIKERDLFQEMYEDHGLVFCTEMGKPLDPRNFKRTFDGLIKKAGVPQIRIHDMRHTHATLLLAAGIHPKVVAERLGHAEVTTTLKVYSHVLPSLQREAANAIERTLTSDIRKNIRNSFGDGSDC